MEQMQAVCWLFVGALLLAALSLVLLFGKFRETKRLLADALAAVRRGHEDHEAATRQVKSLTEVVGFKDQEYTTYRRWTTERLLTLKAELLAAKVEAKQQREAALAEWWRRVEVERDRDALRVVLHCEHQARARKRKAKPL